jgi:hypothetical protein
MLWEAVPTALAAAFAPATLVTVAWFLSRDRPLRLSLAFLAAAASVTVAVGIVMVALLAGTGLDDKPQHPAAPPALDLGLGLLALVAAAVLARRSPHEAKPHHRDPRVITAVLLGVALGSPSPLYVLSLHSLSQAKSSTATLVLEVLVLAAIVLLMAEIPIATYLFAPERTAAALSAANAWLARNGQRIAVVAAAVVGFYFTVKGIVGLT